MRLGYAYNENPMKSAGAVTVGDVVLPDGIPGLRYVQGQFAAITNIESRRVSAFAIC